MRAPKKFSKLVALRSSAVIAALLIIGSILFGFAHERRFSNLHSKPSGTPEHGYGSLYTKEDEPSAVEIDAGKRALQTWLTLSPYDRYQNAYDIVRGKTLVEMNGAEIARALGVPTSTSTDNPTTLEYLVGGDSQRTYLIVTFEQRATEARVRHAALFDGEN